MLEGLRGKDSIAEFCRREGIVQNLYLRWSKDFLETGKKRLDGDTARDGGMCGLAGGAHTGGSQPLRISDSSQREVVGENVKPLDREME